MIYCRLLTCFFCFTLILISLNAIALPPASPAGGRMLRLDETHDFVGTGQAWFPNGQFEILTAEAWIYLEERPERGTFWSIIGQEGRFNLLIHGNGGGLGGWVRKQDAKRPSIISHAKPFPIREWVHVVGFFDVKVSFAINGNGGIPRHQEGPFGESDKPLRIGGIVPQGEELPRFVGKNVKLRGYIDQVRISNILRYEERNWKVPEDKFKVDEHTIGLWHFSDSPWAGRFKDESENGYYLWKSDVMSVEARDKLTTLWAALKR